MFVVNVEDGPNQMWRMAPIKGYPSNRLSCKSPQKANQIISSQRINIKTKQPQQMHVQEYTLRTPPPPQNSSGLGFTI